MIIYIFLIFINLQKRKIQMQLDVVDSYTEAKGASGICP